VRCCPPAPLKHLRAS